MDPQDHSRQSHDGHNVDFPDTFYRLHACRSHTRLWSFGSGHHGLIPQLALVPPIQPEDPAASIWLLGYRNLYTKWRRLYPDWTSVAYDSREPGDSFIR